MQPVVAYSTRTLVSTGHVRRYTFGWSLDRYRATDSVAWVRLRDGAVLAAVNSWGTSWPTDVPSHTIDREVNSTNAFHQSEAAERADDALLASCREWGLAE